MAHTVARTLAAVVFAAFVGMGAAEAVVAHVYSFDDPVAFVDRASEPTAALVRGVVALPLAYLAKVVAHSA